MQKDQKGFLRAISWVPSLYFIEGLPYIMVNVVSVIFYKRMEVDLGDITLYTSLLYWPWVIKPIWSPFVDVIRTKKFWIILTQAAMAVGFAGVALTLPMDNFFRYSLAMMWFLAFMSATHDVAADGFYMLGLKENLQAGFVGVRSFFYRIAMLTGQGALVVFAGRLEKEVSIVEAWQSVFFLLAGMLAVAAIYHWIAIPKIEENTPNLDTDQTEALIGEIGASQGGISHENDGRLTPVRQENQSFGAIFKDVGKVLGTFFQKDHIGLILAFLLLYRLGEAQLGKVASPFLLDDRAVGGLGLDTEAVGYIYGTIGVVGLVAGGILGGLAAAWKGLKFWLWPMIIAINLPNLLYVYLAMVQPESQFLVSICVAIEQFGYGFGFTAYMLYLIYVSDGPYKTAHFALGTGLMALGMMVPGAFSGEIQQWLGYPKFFLWVVIATIPAFIIVYFLPLDPEFGKKRE
ncbi:MAG: MFS transporter [Bacteroidota bacterium]